jgi:hypothetical protein
MIVAYPLGRAEFCNGGSVMSAWVPIDDSVIDPVTGDADPDTKLEGPIIAEIVGPGVFTVKVWRGADQTKNPWREIVGLVEADSPVTFPVGGPVKNLSDITWAVSAQGH